MDTRDLPQTRPSTTASAPDPAGAAQRFSGQRSVERQWWTGLGSPQLDALEDEALRRNGDVAAAEAVLRQARELYLAQRGGLLPNVQLAASADRIRNAGVLASPLSSNAQSYALYGAQFNVGYVLDVFGGQRHQIAALAAQADTQRFALEAVRLTLTANVAVTAVQMASLNDQLTETRRAIACYRHILDVTRRMQALGEGTTADVASAEATLEQAEQTLPPLEKQLRQLQDLMGVYVGRSVTDQDLAGPGATGLSLAGFRLPTDLPLALPSDLVRQRPDVRAAEANLRAASAQLGVAVAARLPSVTLTGALGGTSTRLGSLVSADNVLWAVGTSASQVLFDGGASRHLQGAAEAGLDLAKAQYRSAVLAALQNTADVLQSIDKDATTLVHASRAAAAAEHAAALSRSLFVRGETGIIPARTAEAAAAQAQLALIAARAARFTDTIGLYQALGGGWVDRPATADDTPPQGPSGARP